MSTVMFFTRVRKRLTATVTAELNVSHLKYVGSCVQRTSF